MKGVNKKQTALNCLSVLVIIGTLAFLGLLGFWLLWPAPNIIEIREVKMLTPVVQVGSVASFEFTYTKREPGPGDFSIGLVDGSYYLLESGIVNSPVGTFTTTRSVDIPQATPPNDYHLEVLIEYEINPLQNQKVEFATDVFKVVE